jgi:hypothetical protein
MVCYVPYVEFLVSDVSIPVSVQKMEQAVCKGVWYCGSTLFLPLHLG